jgi:hypothetical protein
MRMGLLVGTFGQVAFSHLVIAIAHFGAVCWRLHQADGATASLVDKLPARLSLVLWHSPPSTPVSGARETSLLR